MAEIKSQIPAIACLREDQHVAIWKEVKNGRGHHGDFLRAFAEAVIRADHENLSRLISASIFLVHKYKLLSYLEDSNAK